MGFLAGLWFSPLAAARILEIDVHSAFSRYGEYYANLSIGSQEFRLQIDTGSSDFGVPQYGCSTCGAHTDARYHPQKSPTASMVNCTYGDEMNYSCHPCHNNQCAYSISYEDDSGYSAGLWLDSVEWSGRHGSIIVPNTPVGGIYRDHRKNPLQPHFVDGIIGLAYRSIANSHAQTPMERLFAENTDVDQIFALCLNSKNSGRPVGGKLVIGSPDGNPFYAKSKNIQWSPLVNETYYPVDMLAMKVGGVVLKVSKDVYNRGGAIVDSGSTTVTLPSTAFSAFRHQMLEMCKDNNQLVGICVDSNRKKIKPGESMLSGECHTLNSDEISAFPDITVILQGAELKMPPTLYLRPSLCDDSSQVTLGFDSGPAADGTILGDVLMENYFSIFDRRHQMVGFGDADDFC